MDRFGSPRAARLESYPCCERSELLRVCVRNTRQSQGFACVFFLDAHNSASLSLTDPFLNGLLADDLFRTRREVTVREVAFELGFKDPYYFSRLYRKHRGHPPSQTIRAARGGL